MHGVNINTCIRLCTTADAHALSTWTPTSVVTSTFTQGINILRHIHE